MAKRGGGLEVFREEGLYVNVAYALGPGGVTTTN